MLYSIELRSQDAGLNQRKCLFCRLGVYLCTELLLFDAGLLAGESAEIEDTSAADLTDLVDFDAVDERRLVRENPFNTDSARDLADREGPGERGSSVDLDDYAAEFLKSVFVAFFNSVGDCDGVASLELRVRSDLAI